MGRANYDTEYYRTRAREIFTTQPGITAKAIAFELGIDPVTVCRYLRRLRPKRTCRKWQPEELALLTNSTLSPTAIAAELGRSCASVYHQRSQQKLTRTRNASKETEDSVQA